MGEQTVRKTFKYKLKATREHERVLERTLMLCRHVYNAAVGERREAWQKRGVSVGYYQQKAELPPIKADMPKDGKVNSQVLQDVIQRVDHAFQAFLCRVKVGEAPGYPRFHGRNRSDSFTYPQVGEHGGARLDKGFLVLSKIGHITLRWSRPMEGTPKSVIVIREADRWYVCCSCADVPTHPFAPTRQEARIDLGLESFTALADGTVIHNLRWYRRAERHLKTAQRGVARRKKGSNRRKKAVKLLARAHLKVKCRRADFHHKVALRLVQTHDTLYHEDLQTANVVKHHYLAKSIADAAWPQFLTILSFKAACAGRSVVAVPPAYTRRTCSGCGVLVQKGLSVRWHSCPDCGTGLHRDHNPPTTSRGSVRAFGEAWRWPRRSTENPPA
jgi:putative transposase